SKPLVRTQSLKKQKKSPECLFRAFLSFFQRLKVILLYWSIETKKPGEELRSAPFLPRSRAYLKSKD
uniref:hypothetical protein n=1 Tax=Bilophila wadsworthia TaxID=35833 RepID=UPI003FEF3AE3